MNPAVGCPDCKYCFNTPPEHDGDIGMCFFVGLHCFTIGCTHEQRPELYKKFKKGSLKEKSKAVPTPTSQHTRPLCEVGAKMDCMFGKVIDCTQPLSFMWSESQFQMLCEDLRSS